MLLLYTNIGQTLVNSLHGQLNCEIGGLDCRVITTEYITRVHSTVYTHVIPILQCVHLCNLFGSVWSMFLYKILVLLNLYFPVFVLLLFFLVYDLLSIVDTGRKVTLYKSIDRCHISLPLP